MKYINITIEKTATNKLNRCAVELVEANINTAMTKNTIEMSITHTINLRKFHESDIKRKDCRVADKSDRSLSINKRGIMKKNAQKTKRKNNENKINV